MRSILGASAAVAVVIRFLLAGVNFSNLKVHQNPPQSCVWWDRFGEFRIRARIKTRQTRSERSHTLNLCCMRSLRPLVKTRAFGMTPGMDTCGISPGNYLGQGPKGCMAYTNMHLFRCNLT